MVEEKENTPKWLSCEKCSNWNFYVMINCLTKNLPLLHRKSKPKIIFLSSNFKIANKLTRILYLTGECQFGSSCGLRRQHCLDVDQSELFYETSQPYI
ncbi:hypothetical protein BpHYR1_024277 [Brachionus plicatilis]|uniref:Uncharacterized protein n=1 Tax=Brachionus plicatilis TaxID=10195 RepID=A0A3M7SEZ2_BRAPC|nr:hypothetical protein BpHYR1_024277 [Brachionus plicatilis]